MLARLGQRPGGGGAHKPPGGSGGPALFLGRQVGRPVKGRQIQPPDAVHQCRGHAQPHRARGQQQAGRGAAAVVQAHRGQRGGQHEEHREGGRAQAVLRMCKGCWGCDSEARCEGPRLTSTLLMVFQVSPTDRCRAIANTGQHRREFVRRKTSTVDAARSTVITLHTTGKTCTQRR